MLKITEDMLLSTTTAMFPETPIKLDKKSTTNDKLAEAISDIKNVLEHLSLELNLRKSDTNNQIDELANIIAAATDNLKLQQKKEGKI